MAGPEPRWHKSTYSGASGRCVGAAEGRTVPVRDTRNRELGHLDHTPEA
jgi:nitrite reductase/ring-hydroxylating ferredoxin subunit